MLERAYSTFELKAIDEDVGLIEGYASTPNADRSGDVLDSAGAKFELPMPLLWQHDKHQPIGQVTSAEVTPGGIKIRAKVWRELATVQDKWAYIKAGLRGLSVGWLPLEAPTLETKGKTTRFKSWLWLETSVVTIPMNAGASILQIKSFDDAATRARAAEVRPSAGGTASETRAPGLARKTMPKTYKDRLADWTATKDAAVARQEAIQTKASDEGRAKDDAERETFDELTAEIAKCDRELADLHVMQTRLEREAVPVQAKSMDEAAKAREFSPIVRVRPVVDPSFTVPRMLMCKAAAFISGGSHSALEIAQARYPDAGDLHLALKAAVPAMTTTGTFGANLTYAPDFAAGFIEWMNPALIIGRLQGMTRVQFNARWGIETSGGTAFWVGQAKPKPLTNFTTDEGTVGMTKLAAITVMANELVLTSSPSADVRVRELLKGAVQRVLDHDFIDPDNAGTSGVKPPSITNGVTPITSAGTDAASVIADFMALLAPVYEGNLSAGDVAIIMPTSLAFAASLMVNAFGQPVFAGLTPNGGTLNGIQVITTQAAALGGLHGNIVIAVHAPSIYLADEGQISVDVSSQASVEMSSTPTQDATAGTGAELVSLWQSNLFGVRAERMINWKRARPEAVSWIDDVAWAPAPAATTTSGRGREPKEPRKTAA